MKNNRKCVRPIAAIALLLSFMMLQAQKNRVLNAYNYERSYQKTKKCSDLKKGKEEIDAAASNEQTMNEAKTWYYRGNIYYAIAMSEDPLCHQIDPEAADKAYDSYIKALKYNIKDPGYKDLDIENNQEHALKFLMALTNANTKFEDPAYNADILAMRFPYLSNKFINIGVDYFQNKKDYNKAYENFGKGVGLAQLTGRIDTLGLYYTAIAAQKADKKEEAIKIYEALTQLKYNGNGEGPKIYAFLGQLYKEKGDSAKYIETIRKGRNAYPNDKALIIEELDYYLQKGDNQQALTNLNIAIEKDPSNPVLFFARGTIYDKKGDITKAEQDYLKAIELKPDYFDALYNLGALYYNIGVDYNNKSNDLPPSELKKAKELQDKAAEEFKKAKPYLEKANQLQPDDTSVVKSLLKVYALTGETEKYKALKSKYSE